MKSYTHYIVVFLMLFLVTTGKAQQLFHQDVFYGGVTAAGWSSGLSASGSGTIEIYIEPGSTIRNAWLFMYSFDTPVNSLISINNNSISEDSLFELTTNEYTLTINNPFKVYQKNIKNIISPSTLLYSVEISNFGTNQSPNQGYWCPIIYVEYENSNLNKIATSLWINDLDLIGRETYNFQGLNPISTLNNVALSLMIDRACSSANDKTEVFVNETLITPTNSSDAVGGENLNSLQSCSGVKGHFYYQNSTLNGLDSSLPNSSMANNDALANISPYLSNGETSYELELKHVQWPFLNDAATNVATIFPHAYTTTCDTFSTQVAFSDTTICQGDTIQLGVSGGINYDWTNPNNMNGETTANPVVWPDSTTLYVVRVENEPGCSRTEQVLVRVNELPEITSVSITPSECGEDNGEVDATTVGEGPFISDLGFGSQNQAQFPDLSAGMYTLSITDQNGCTADTMVVVPEIISVDASFIASPPSGPEPLSVSIYNTSQNATNYEWYIDEDFWDGNVNSSAYFDSSGVYEVMLIAYNNLPECADATWLTILIQDTLVVQIPNVFSPNNDNSNDVFTIDIRGAQYIKASISNRWGNEMSYLEQDLTSTLQTLPIWNGVTNTQDNASEGVYFYLFEITDVKSEVYTFSGYLHLVR